MEANALAGAQTITLPAGIYLFALVGIGENAAATGDLDITGDLKINATSDDSTIIDGGGLDRIFEIFPGAVVKIDGVVIRNGYPGIGIGRGGGIRNRGVMTLANSVVTNNTGTFLGGGIWNSGTMTLTNTTISGNAEVVTPSGESGGGGGIFNQGTMTLIGTTVSGNTTNGYGGRGGGISNLDQMLTLINSTISGNTGYNGGAIFNRYGSIQLTYSTISGNTAIAQGGGIWNYGGSANIKNTIVANNSPSDLLGVITTLGRNLFKNPGASIIVGNVTVTADIIGVDPMLGPLADNGGTTMTHALLLGSPAIDAVPLTFCIVSTDQRGIVRPQGASCDIGSYELSQPFFILTKPAYELSSNFPNPYNPTTTIKYQIPDAGFVTLKVYDVLGNEVALLVNEKKEEGRYNVTFNASALSSGVYIYQLRVNDFIDTKKMTLLK